MWCGVVAVCVVGSTWLSVVWWCVCISCSKSSSTVNASTSVVNRWYVCVRSVWLMRASSGDRPVVLEVDERDARVRDLAEKGEWSRSQMCVVFKQKSRLYNCVGTTSRTHDTTQGIRRSDQGPINRHLISAEQMPFLASLAHRIRHGMHVLGPLHQPLIGNIAQKHIPSISEKYFDTPA